MKDARSALASASPASSATALRSFLRGAAVLSGLVFAWHLFVVLSDVPAFMLPAPIDVARRLVRDGAILMPHFGVTALETVGGLIIGVMVGTLTALVMASAPVLRHVAAPVLAITQALPVFAIAPLLVLWFGFGIGSKLVMASLIIYFPVASTLYDALTRTDPGLIDLMRLMKAGRLRTLLTVRLPAALPALGSGLRVSATLAPIGAIVGEWVGAAAGLGFVMIQAQARGRIETVFAALILLMALALTLRALADLVARRIAPWARETLNPALS